MEEKVKLTKTRYRELKKLLLSKSQDDFDLGCENVKNIDISSIAIILLAKSLSYGRRAAFMETFTKNINSVYSTNKNIISSDLSWEILFPVISKSPELTDLDKSIVSSELEELVTGTLECLDYKFIKKLNLELKW